MKRIGNLYQTIVSLENLNIADGKAQKGKSNQYGVIKHNLNPYHNIWKLHNILVDKKYKTSNYKGLPVSANTQQQSSYISRDKQVLVNIRHTL